MLLFRSEEHVDKWNAARQATRGGMMTLEQLWKLARRWYGDRLDPQWGRRRPEDAQAILTEVGLTGAFWQLQPQPQSF
ncbi:MAG: hypothetical protein ACRDKT_07735 [Actinomycetota bacterium]